MGEKSTIKERAKRNLLGELVTKLGAWCAEKRGRQTELARLTGATRQAVNDWLNGRKKMNGEQALKADAFMRKVRAGQRCAETHTEGASQLGRVTRQLKASHGVKETQAIRASHQKRVTSLELSEPTQSRNPFTKSEPSLQRNPKRRSEPHAASKPAEQSEPKRASKPESPSEP
jgi:hypothetical protein